MAVAEGFEPSDGGYPSHAFEACSLGRSDTPPWGSLPGTRPEPIIARLIASAALFAQALTAAARRTPPAARRIPPPKPHPEPLGDG